MRGAAGDAGGSDRGPRHVGSRAAVRREQLWLLWGVAAVLLVSLLARWGWRAGWWAPQAKVVKGPPREYRIDLNQAEEGEFALLPGIGEVKAGRIVAYRKEHGPFSSVEDLLAVEGISSSVLARLLPYVRLGPPPRRAVGLRPAGGTFPGADGPQEVGDPTGEEEVPSSNKVSSSR